MTAIKGIRNLPKECKSNNTFYSYRSKSGKRKDAANFDAWVIGGDLFMKWKANCSTFFLQIEGYKRFSANQILMETSDTSFEHHDSPIFTKLWRELGLKQW